MSNIPICRICLRTDIKLYQYDRFRLKFFYEQVMGLKVNELDGLPHFFCLECATMLHKFHKFKEKCYSGQKALKEILWRESITINSVARVDKITKNLLSPLQLMTVTERVKTYTFICKERQKKTRRKKDADSKLELEIDENTFKMDLSEEMLSDNDDTQPNLDPVDDESDKEGLINVFENDNEMIFNPVGDDDEKDMITVLNNEPISDMILDENNDVKDLYVEEMSVLKEKETEFKEEICNNDYKETDSSEKLNFENLKSSLLQSLLIENSNTKNATADDDMIDLDDITPLSDIKLLDIAKIEREEKIDNGLKKKTVNKKTRSRKVTISKKQEKAKNDVKIKAKDAKLLESRFKVHKKRKNFLDEKNWRKINLNPEEAMKEFKKRALDKKYTTAPYQCEDCLKGFSRHDILDRHKKLRHAQSLGPIECYFCRMRFKWACHLRRHIREHYTKYQCLRCDLVCYLETTALFHEEYHNGVLRKCAHCDLEFGHMSTYYTHLRTHRSDNVCSLCGQSFVSQAGLKQHRRIRHINFETETPEDENMFCEKCDIKFETREAYQEHLYQTAKHIEDLGTDKPITNKKFRKGREMRRNPRKPRTCNHCGKHFGTQTAYLKHHMAEHPRTSLHDPGDRQICEICGASLLPNSMVSHMNTHTREKLHTCSTCGRQFNASITLKNHLLTHTGEKPWPCSLCEKRFTQKGSMQLHYRTFHLKQPYPKRNRRKKDEVKIGISNKEDSDDLFLSRWR